MKLFLCQNGKNVKLPIAIPYSQLILAAQVEDICEVRVSGYGADGGFPTTDEVLEQIKEFCPDVVGITVNFAYLVDENILLAETIKKLYPHISIIVGGHHATFTANELIQKSCIDAVFLGESEQTLRKFVLSGSFSDVPGVVYKKAGVVRKNEQSFNLADLDSLKPPAYHLLPRGGLKFVLGVESSRGCPFNCDFCEVRNFFGNKSYRRMKPETFVNNLKYVIEKQGGGYFIVMDDCFTADMNGHVRKVCELLIKEKLPAPLSITARMDNLLKNMDMIPLMAQAGVRMVTIGVESIYEDTLKALNKQASYNAEQLEYVFRTLSDHNIATLAGIVFGYPNETPEMIDATIDFLRASNVTHPLINIATPFPGSRLYERAIARNQIIESDYIYYDGLHRVTKEIPEHTPEAVANGRRKFFLDSDRIYRLFKNGIDSIDMKALLGGGQAIADMSQKAGSLPRNTAEWMIIFDAIIRVVKDYKDKLPDTFTGTVGFIFEGNSIEIEVKDGVITNCSAGIEKADITIQMDIPVLLDLLLWNNLDIVSACILGSCKSSFSDFSQYFLFIDWFTAVQDITRWIGLMKLKVPQIKKRIHSWLSSEGVRRKKSSYLYKDGLSLFIGNKNSGGFLIGFSSVNVISWEQYLEFPEETNYFIDADDNLLCKILKGSEDTLLNAILSESVLLNEPQNDLDSSDNARIEQFFTTLPLKFIPEKSEGIDLTFQYLIKDGEEDKSWYVTIADKKINVVKGFPEDNSTISMVMRKESFLKLIKGYIDPIELFRCGEIQYKGAPHIMLDVAKCIDNPYGKSFSLKFGQVAS